jgi:ABC-type lipoprotein release transport system permease subunit
MSRLPFELLLALRYLRPKRTFVSVITLISVLGVCLGVAVLIIVISVMSGFDLQLRDKILGFNSHLKIAQPGHTMGNYKEVMRKVKANPQVSAAAPPGRCALLARRRYRPGDEHDRAAAQHRQRHIRSLQPRAGGGQSVCR